MFKLFARGPVQENVSLKVFEVWVKTVRHGMFITQESAEMIGTIDAENQAHADYLASMHGGYATARIER